MSFQFYTKPFDHQEVEFHYSCDKENYAVLWEQGTGKSKLICDQFTYLWQQGKINGVLVVVAPNGVQHSWAIDQIQEHCDPKHNIKIMVWDGKRSHTKAFKEDFNGLFDTPVSKLAVFLINYEAVRTAKGYAACEMFLEGRRCLMVCDESHRIKSPKALQTKCIIKLGKLACYRRILTGTAIGNSAFDIYTQFKFLDPKILGFKSWYAFRNYFGIFEQTYVGRWINQLKSYRRLDELQKLIHKHSSRVLKVDVLDLPERLYTKRYYTMEPKQAALYDDLKTKYMIELESGQELSAPLALVRLLRLQQILCGYLPIDEENIRIPDSTKNPRIECLKEVLEDYEDSKIIIWCRFTEDIRQVEELLGKGYVSYYGEINSADRPALIEKFNKDKNTRYFIANTQCGGTGLNLQAANVCIYYSNNFSLIDRQQSEDRLHRIGQKNKVIYIDLVCRNTVDEHIIKSLRSNQKIAQAINGDKLRLWI